ncbi:hypothetical protein ACFL4L_01095 [bacterium]
MNTILNVEKIQDTIEKLYLRIQDRFPDSGLSGVCQTLHSISLETCDTLRWISKPNYLVRFSTYLIVILIILTTVYSISKMDLIISSLSVSDLVQMFGSALEGIAIAIAGIIFIITFENRAKRKKIISAINRLRCIAHIIDAHQLTKNPDGISQLNIPTSNSPKRKLNKYELGRYLEYCSEMLSLLSKTGFLYIQDFHDSIATDAVNDLEVLATGLSRKIWQKIMIIQSKEA